MYRAYPNSCRSDRHHDAVSTALCPAGRRLYRYITAQSPIDGCSSNKTTNATGNIDVIPNIGAIVGGAVRIMFLARCLFTQFKFLPLLELRSQIGGQYVPTWTLFNATQIQQHGLWCQVNSASNAGKGSNIGDMFYPTGDGPDGFTVVPTGDTNNSVPYQQLKCNNQIGLIVDGNVTNNQAIVKCNTTIPNLEVLTTTG